jgi:hypothetical protein
MILVDRGAWFDKEGERSVKVMDVYELYNNHPNIDWYFTGE